MAVRAKGESDAELCLYLAFIAQVDGCYLEQFAFNGTTTHSSPHFYFPRGDNQMVKAMKEVGRRPAEWELKVFKVSIFLGNVWKLHKSASVRAIPIARSVVETGERSGGSL